MCNHEKNWSKRLIDSYDYYFALTNAGTLFNEIEYIPPPDIIEHASPPRLICELPPLKNANLFLNRVNIPCDRVIPPIITCLKKIRPPIYPI